MFLLKRMNKCHDGKRINHDQTHEHEKYRLLHTIKQTQPKIRKHGCFLGNSESRNNDF